MFALLNSMALTSRLGSSERGITEKQYEMLTTQAYLENEIVIVQEKLDGSGSVKTNIGHLLSAAGIASFIKVVLSLQHKQLPPTLNYETPNPSFEFSSSPFYPNTTLTQWKPKEGIRRAGISSFGFGGTYDAEHQFLPK